MSGSVQIEKKYPKLPEDIEQEREIIDGIKKLSPLSLKLKAFALNYHTLKLKELGIEEDEEIERINADTQKNFQQYLQSINDMVNGTRHPTDEELVDLQNYLNDEDLSKKDEILSNLKPLPNYWFTVLKNDTVIRNHITENDEKALKHLARVEYKFSEDADVPHNFTITLHFTPNDFFENQVLSVYFHMKEPRDVTKTEGTEIQWKAGKDFTKKVVTKKQKNKKTGQTRTINKEESVPSFFNLFKSITAPDENKELGEEEEELQNQILDQVDIAYSLIEEAIPFSLEYFLGVRKDFLPGEDDEDFEDEDEDDDDDDEPKTKTKGKPTKGGKGGALGGDKGGAFGGAGGKQECKQQ